MGDIGLTGCPQKRYRVTTQSNHGFGVAPNQLDREFTADRPNQRWEAGITYIGTREDWLYLAAAMDLHSKAIVGWSVCERLNRDLVISGMMMAIWQRKPGSDLVHHSDPGGQYASDDFQSLQGSAA